MTLDEIRVEIDAIDTQMKTLFLQRMQLSEKVAESKKETEGKVFVPEREREIIANRSCGISKEYNQEYIAFLKHMMCLSRTYQYSLMMEKYQELIKEIPEEYCRIIIEFAVDRDENSLHQYVEILEMSGIDMERINSIEPDDEEKLGYQMVLAGDFSEQLKKGALVQILLEADEVRVHVER